MGADAVFTPDKPQGYESSHTLTRCASFNVGAIATGTASSVEVRATELLPLDSMSVKDLARFNGQSSCIVAENGATEPQQSGGIVLHCPRTPRKEQIHFRKRRMN